MLRSLVGSEMCIRDRSTQSTWGFLIDQQMGNKPAPPPQPQKTVKELVKESSRAINKMRREFQREMNKVEMNNNKIRFDIKKMVDRKEPRSSIRIVAQQILKNNQIVKKYQRLDAQLSNALYQLNSAATTDALVNIMKDVSKIFKMSSDKFDVKNMQVALQQFNSETEKLDMMNDQINDMMEDDEDEVTDEEADKLINAIEFGGGEGGQKIAAPQKNENDLNEIENRLKNL
eukprot:TRINITY_DN2722_c0_g1_i1.p1 TRINITY_DN2722_c0_g1~~TRINITY_DN2722_c0_g1_i1.p1  ORF type:complete len:231 (+),score=74.26 TRINITY_DN2722_c0_g1_i1:78-770(+)